MPEEGIFNLDADLSDLGESIFAVQQDEEYVDIEVLKETLNKQHTHHVDQINLSSLQVPSNERGSSHESKSNDQKHRYWDSTQTLEDIVLSKIHRELEEERQILVNQLEKQLLRKERGILNLWDGIKNLLRSAESDKLFFKQEEREERLWKKRVGIYKAPDFTRLEEIKKNKKKLLLNLPIEVIHKKNILEFKKYFLSELANVSISKNEQEYFNLINITPKDLVVSMQNFIAAWKNTPPQDKPAAMMDFQLEFKKYLEKQFCVHKLRRKEEYYSQSTEQSESKYSIQSELKDDEFIEREIPVPDDKYSLTSGLAHAHFQELSSQTEQQSIRWFVRLQNWLHDAYHKVKDTLFGCFSGKDDEKKSYAISSWVEEKSPISSPSSFYYFNAVSRDLPQPSQPLPYKKVFMDKTPSFKTLHTLFAERDDKKSDREDFIYESEKKESQVFKP